MQLLDSPHGAQGVGTGEERFIQKLLIHYRPRIDDAAQFAISQRVLLLQTDSGVGLDVALVWDELERLRVSIKE